MYKQHSTQHSFRHSHTAGDADTLAGLLVGVTRYLVGAPEAWQIAPLFGHTIDTASVSGPVQSQAYAKSIASLANAFYVKFLLDCAEPQVDQGRFTYQRMFSQV